MAKLNEYLTVGEAAEILGVSKDTLRRWDRSGKLPAHRHPITGYRLYARHDLEALLDSVPDADARSERTPVRPRRRRR